MNICDLGVEVKNKSMQMREVATDAASAVGQLTLQYFGRILSSTTALASSTACYLADKC